LPLAHYSYRNASVGALRDARHAGSQLAARTTAPSVTTAMPITAVSLRQ
jgi:hypothetical protein